MNRISIDRLDLSLTGLAARTAQGVQAALPGALQQQLQRRLAQRLARGGTAVAAARLGAADLGTLTVARRPDPQAIADAIAARLADWIDGQLDAADAAGAP